MDKQALEAKANILIVEDEVIIAADLKQKLKIFGYSVCGLATSSEEAIQMTRTERPDLVLMDIILEGRIDGIKTAEIIRIDYETPVVFLTAYADTERLERAKLVYPFGYILKPFHDRDLKVTIEMALYVSRVDAQRRRAEEALRISEQKYRSLFEGAADAVFLENLNNDILDVNPRACEMLGYSREELKQMRLPDIVAPEEKVRGKGDLKDELKQYRRTHFESTDVRKDGTRLPVEVSLSLVSEEKEGLVYSIVRDITERKQAEEALRESEARYRYLFDNSPVGIAIADMEGNIIDYNRAILKPGGYQSEDIDKIGNLSQLSYHPEERKRILDEARRQGFVDEFEVRLKRKDGTPYDATLSLRPLLIKGESYWQVIVQDITERKQLTDTLRKSEERYALAVQAGQVGVWDWDLATGRIYIDPMLKAILGFDDHEIANHLDEWGQRVHPEDREVVMKAADDHILGITPHYTVEHRMLHRDGSVRWFLAHGNVIRNERGDPVCMIGTDQDITDRKLAEIEREKLIDELQSALAEVKTLSGFLPICINCKKIRDDKGYWQRVERYIQERTEAQFSHSICPDCAKRIYPEFYADE